MKTFLRESVLLFFVITPLVYLAATWSAIPDVIPTHYGISGKADAFGNKSSLLWGVPLFLIGLYSMISVVPLIDPKRRIQFADKGFFTLRLLTTALISLLCLGYLMAIQNKIDINRTVSVLLMTFTVLIGNYFPVLKPNYFIGIRSPWTLEREDVWKKTHRVSGRVWMAGGMVGLVLILVWPGFPVIGSAVILTLLALFSLIYSYRVYKEVTQ